MKILRKPKTLLVAAALVAVAALVSACGGGGSSSESSTSTSGRTVDQAFVAEMIPHHELAVEMAEIAQGEGRHSQITRLADDIVESQSAEIEEMKPIAAEIGATEGSEGHGMEGMPDEGMPEMEMGHEGGSSESRLQVWVRSRLPGSRPRPLSPRDPRGGTSRRSRGISP